MKNRVCFPGCNYALRTDEDFKIRKQVEHHVRLVLKLEELNIGCVSIFPIDYMHCVLLGVMRQLLNIWLKIRKKPFSLKQNAINSINENLRNIRKYLPREFARKQRTFDELEHWKATELRTFLMYTGIAAFSSILEEKYYKHFLLLVCSIRILTHPEDCTQNNNCAAEMLREFVKQFPILYGIENVSYNVHSLLHLSSDVKALRNLDSYILFKFENLTFKKMVKKGSFPIQQIVNKL